jgi:uncharacterized protein (TIGR03000 family)
MRCRIALLFILGGMLPGTPLSAQPGTPKPPDPQSIIFEVRVPEGALVEVQGSKTMTTGEVRKYRTPAMPLGRRYSYTIKVTYEGKTSVYELGLTHAGPNVLDVRRALGGTRPAPDTKKASDKAKPPPADLPQDDPPPGAPKAEGKKPPTKEATDKPKGPPVDLPQDPPPRPAAPAKKDEPKKQ